MSFIPYITAILFFLFKQWLPSIVQTLKCNLEKKKCFYPSDTKVHPTDHHTVLSTGPKGRPGPTMMSHSGQTVWKGDSLNLTTFETALGSISALLQDRNADTCSCLTSVHTLIHI